MERKHMGMTPELRKYYEDRFSMFASQGWSDFLADVQVMLDSTNTLDGVTPDNVKFKQGEVSIMRWILAQKQMFETSYEELNSANNP